MLLFLAALAGAGLSGHVYDDIAPKLTDGFHVDAVTRRGVGTSDRPPAGYDRQRRAHPAHAGWPADYARIKVPVLAIYRSSTLAQALQDFPPGNDREREAVALAVEARRTVLTKRQGDLLAGVPAARIVELPGASLYMFLSHEADVVREIRSFAATLTP